MLRWRVWLAVLVLILVLAQPLLRQGYLGIRLVFGQDAILRAGQELDGHLVVLGGDAVIEPGSTVHGDVLALGGSIRIRGRVDGQAFAPSGNISLGASAAVAKDVLASGTVVREPGAIVRGEVMDRSGDPSSLPLPGRWRERCVLSLPGLWFGWPWGVGLAGNLIVWVLQVLLGSLVMVTIGILVVLLVPGPSNTTSRALGNYPLQSIGMGLLTWLLAVLAVPILISTVIGIPAAVAGVIALAIATLFAWVPAGLALGERLLLHLRSAKRQPFVALAVGLPILSALSSIPCLGFLVMGLVAIWGVGAVVLTRFGTRSFGT